MNRQVSGDQLQGLLMHGEHLLEHVEERSAKLARIPATVLNVLLGVCLGMLIAYAVHFKLPAVEFNIVGPLMGGAGGALASLVSRDRTLRKREERLRLEKLEAASRLQMAGQIVDFLRSQGRLLPDDVKDGAWTEVSHLLAKPKTRGAASSALPLIGTLLPQSKS